MKALRTMLRYRHGISAWDGDRPAGEECAYCAGTGEASDPPDFLDTTCRGCNGSGQLGELRLSMFRAAPMPWCLWCWRDHR